MKILVFWTICVFHNDGSRKQQLVNSEIASKQGTFSHSLHKHYLLKGCRDWGWGGGERGRMKDCEGDWTETERRTSNAGLQYRRGRVGTWVGAYNPLPHSSISLQWTNGWTNTSNGRLKLKTWPNNLWDRRRGINRQQGFITLFFLIWKKGKLPEKKAGQ